MFASPLQAVHLDEAFETPARLFWLAEDGTVAATTCSSDTMWVSKTLRQYFQLTVD